MISWSIPDHNIVALCNHSVTVDTKIAQRALADEQR